MTQTVKITQSIARFGENQSVEVVVEVGETIVSGIVRQLGKYTISLPPETQPENYTTKTKELLVAAGLCSPDAQIQ